MFLRRLSLSRLLLMSSLVSIGLLVSACGQKGPLYLAVEEGEERQEEQSLSINRPASPGSISIPRRAL